VTTLVRSRLPDDPEIEALRSQMADLERALGARAHDVTRVKSALDAFRVRYRQEVGLLHEELDELEEAIADAELGNAPPASELEREGEAASQSGVPPGEPAPRYTSDAVRKLFRDVAKAIHPDLARDDGTRDRRHKLMIEANRAYAVGDEEGLRRILDAWEKSPEAVEGSDQEAMRLRLVRRIAQIEAELEWLAAEFDELKATPLWKLKAMVDEASRQGKDLMRDMIRRLQRDILVARNRLEAMRPPT
jgi:hypothetical protein